jgi:ribonucleotide reductase beta subunit family protein with ferritin-like domain
LGAVVGDEIPYLPAVAAKRKGRAAACLLLNVTTLVAHHSFAAEFDPHRRIKLRGTVTRMKCINRHACIHVNVKAVDGTMVA